MAPENPIPALSLNRLTSLANGLIVDIRRGPFRPLRRTLESNPSVNQELRRSGGFTNVVGGDVFTEESRQTIHRLVGVQTAVILSQLVAGKATNIPSVQTLEAGINKIIDITTKIGTHLEDCCEELKERLKELKAHVTKKNDDLVKLYHSEKRKLKNYLPSLKQEVYASLSDIIGDKLNPLIEKLGSLERKLISIENKLDPLVTKLDSLERKLNSIDQKIDTKFDTVTTKLNTLGTSLSTLLTAFDTYATAWAAWCETYDKVLSGGFTAIEGSIAGVQGTVVARTIVGNRTVSKQLSHSERKFEKCVTTEFGKQKSFLKDKEKGLPFILTNEVCNSIVGESYYKWDSISSFYPTIVFIFNEITDNNKPRKSQIKLRCKQTSKEITDKEINVLIEKAKQCEGLRYTHGSTRGNYVAYNKRFKTTIYGADKETISKVLEKTLSVIPESFDSKLLSITTGTRNRPSLFRRTTSLHNINVNPANYNDSFIVQLKCVKLLVNGISKIIDLTN